MRSIPGIIVVEACDEIELRQVILQAVDYEGPAYIRMIKGDIEPYDRNLVPENYRFAVGKAAVLRDGSDVTLIGSGLMVSRCLEAAEILSEEEIDAEVINCSSIKPMDKETILKSVRKTRAAVTAENHSIIGGMGGAVAEMLSEELPVPIKRVGIEDSYGESGAYADLLEKYHLTSRAVVDASMKVLEKIRVG
jgi:transketolase